MNNKLFLLIFAAGLSNALAGVKSKIVNGEKAKEGEFPWQVGIYWGNGLKCGGTILSEIHIITAAHCVMEGGQPVDAGYLTVVLGTNENFLKPIRKNYGVNNIRIHEYSADESSHKNDIAIISLSQNIKFNHLQRPAKLPSKDTEPDTRVVLCGWGKVKDSKGLLDLPDELQKLETSVISNAQCQKMMMSSISDQQICTYVPGGHGACSGDSGSGLMENDVLVGIASWVYRKCGKTFPDVYTRVHSYLTWIKPIISSND